MITFDAKTGELAKLIDYLAKSDEYNFVHYTRYARIGLMPAGKTFEDFYEQFCNDFEDVLRKRKHIVKKHELEMAEITVQLIAKPLRRNYRTDDESIVGTDRRKMWRDPESVAALKGF